jgi:hypothetical protein
VDDDSIWEAAAVTDNVSCMRLLVQHGVEMDRNACEKFAARGNLNCLKFAHENGSGPGMALGVAAAFGHIGCLMYCHIQGFPDMVGIVESMFMNRGPHLYTKEWKMNALENACNNNQLDCFRYLHEQGYSSQLNLCEFAAYNNSMDCLKCACEEIGDPLDITVTLHGLAWDSTWCVEYVHLERGCPWNEQILVEALMKGAYESFKFAYKHGCPLPAYENGGPLPESLPCWFTSSRLVQACAPVPVTAILRCIKRVHRTTLFHPASTLDALRDTWGFLLNLERESS